MAASTIQTPDGWAQLTAAPWDRMGERGDGEIAWSTPGDAEGLRRRERKRGEKSDVPFDLLGQARLSLRRSMLASVAVLVVNSNSNVLMM
jgi:hypothetical protein